MAENGKATDSKPTERVVLRKMRVIIVPDGATDEQIAAAQKALPRNAVCVQAWEPVKAATGSKTQAIESYAGKPGTPDAIPGTYKAPNVSSWAGGEVYDAPPKPLVERTPLVDEALA